MYNDPINRLFLMYVGKMLKEVNEVNRYFQSEQKDPTKLMSHLTEFYMSLMQQIAVPAELATVTSKKLFDFKFANHIMPLSAIHFGYDFHVLLDSLQLSNPNIDIVGIKERCMQFAIKLAEQVQLRLPENVNVLESLRMFSPTICQKQNKPCILTTAVEFKEACGGSIDT